MHKDYEDEELGDPPYDSLEEYMQKKERDIIRERHLIEIKNKGFYLSENSWESDISTIVRKLRPTNKAGWLVFIERE